jgi:hypothetical protein
MRVVCWKGDAEAEYTALIESSPNKNDPIPLVEVVEGAKIDAIGTITRLDQLCAM